MQSSVLDRVARRLKANPMQIALASLLQRFPNILLIPGTSSVIHLRRNLDAVDGARTRGLFRARQAFQLEWRRLRL